MLTETQIREIINSNSKVIIKIWDDNCPFCTEYSPIFDKVASQYKDIVFASFKIPRSEKENTFRNDFLGGDAAVPKTVIFENGQFKAVAKGRMREDKLIEFISTAKQEVEKPDPKKWAEKASLLELEAQLWQHTKMIEKFQYVKDIFETEWNKRMNRIEG